jgi:hypothetical protein
MVSSEFPGSGFVPQAEKDGKNGRDVSPPERRKLRF